MNSQRTQNFKELFCREKQGLKAGFWVKIYWITKYRTSGYSFPLFSSLWEKEGRRKGECIRKTGFDKVFLIIHLTFQRFLFYKYKYDSDLIKRIKKQVFKAKCTIEGYTSNFKMSFFFIWNKLLENWALKISLQR